MAFFIFKLIFLYFSIASWPIGFDNRRVSPYSAIMSTSSSSTTSSSSMLAEDPCLSAAHNTATSVSELNNASSGATADDHAP